MIPAVDRSTASESRTVASSSTICTQRSYGIFIRSIDLQLNEESGPLWDNRLPPKAACVRLYDLQAQRQTEPHSSRLRSLVGLEQSVHHRGASGAIIPQAASVSRTRGVLVPCDAAAIGSCRRDLSHQRTPEDPAGDEPGRGQTPLGHGGEPPGSRAARSRALGR